MPLDGMGAYELLITNQMAKSHPLCHEKLTTRIPYP